MVVLTVLHGRGRRPPLFVRGAPWTTFAWIGCFYLTVRQFLGHLTLLQLPPDIEYDAPLPPVTTIKPWSVWHVATTSCPTYEDPPLLLLPPEQPNDDWMLRDNMQNDTQGMTNQVFANCSQTSMVRILPKCPYWELQTLDRTGLPKPEGGDEFYVTYTDDAVSGAAHNNNGHPPTAVAEITDLQNGRYRLSFVSSPLNHRYHRLVGSGNITISFQYTCGIGQMAPPTKNAHSWKTGGNIVAQYSTHVDTVPPITPFAPPSSHKRPFLSHNNIIPYGDSNMQHFMAPLSIQLPNIGRPLNTTTVKHWISRLDRLHAMHLKRANANNTVLLVSSHAWDLLEMENSASHVDHGQAIQQFVDHVRTTYPNVTLAWKSPTAMHIHVPMLQINDGRDQKLKRQFGKKIYDRLRYMSTSRSFALYQFQKQTMEVLQIPFLDVYQASYLSADHTYIGDGRHFLPQLNAMMVHWFVGTSLVEELWKRHQTKKRTQRGAGVIRATITDCDESSWGTMANAAIISMVTNRRLEWSTNNCSMPLFRGVNATNYNTINRKSIMSLEEERYAVPLTLAELETNGYLKTDPSKRMAKELFSEGDDFLYGMVLHALLEWPTTSPPTTTLPTTKAVLFDSSESVVFAVQAGSFLFDTESLDTCMLHFQNATIQLSSVAATTTSLPCHVLFPTQELARQWNSKLERQYNCSAISASATTSLSSPDDDSFAYMELVAEMAYDGVMGPCSSIPIMYGKLIHYLRFQNARTRGELPLTTNELPTCCWN